MRKTESILSYEYDEVRKDKFDAHYPEWLHYRITDATTGLIDYLIYEHLVSEAWKLKSEHVKLDIPEFADHYELSQKEIRKQIARLSKLGLLVPLSAPEGCEEPEFRVPLITEIFSLYRSVGVRCANF